MKVQIFFNEIQSIVREKLRAQVFLFVNNSSVVFLIKIKSRSVENKVPIFFNKIKSYNFYFYFYFNYFIVSIINIKLMNVGKK